MPVPSPAGPVQQPLQQSGAPGYLLFLTEQAARPVIHAGIKIRELFDAVGTASAGVRRGLRGCIQDVLDALEPRIPGKWRWSTNCHHSL